MALIGSGTSQVKNFATAASLSASDLDESLAAFVEQFGGVKWLNGASARVAGNLTYDNFTTGLALPNWAKREHRSIYTVSFDIKIDYTTIAFPMHVGAFKAHSDLVIASWDMNIWGNAAITAQPVVKLYVNGTVASAATGKAQSSMVSGLSQTPLVGVSSGSIVAVSITSMTTTSTLFGASCALGIKEDHL